MANSSKRPAYLQKFLDSCSEAEREWFEERAAIIQFSQGKEISDAKAEQMAHKAFCLYRDSQGKRKQAA